MWKRGRVTDGRGDGAEISRKGFEATIESSRKKSIWE